MSDLINRQGLIDILVQMQEVYFDRKVILAKVIDQVKDMPSAEREIIYCKDCIRHNVSVKDWYDNHELKVCPLVDHRGKAVGHEFDYQFCVYAERRTDEAD